MYDYDIESEIKEYKAEIKHLESNLIDCREEINRLRGVIRNTPSIEDMAVSKEHLHDWYQKSIDDTETPVWTDEHIEELCNDFYVIPKEV